MLEPAGVYAMRTGSDRWQRTLGVVTNRVTNHPPSSLETTLYCSIQAASLGPRAFFFRGIVYSTSLFLSPPIDANYTVSMDCTKSQSFRQSHQNSSSHWSHLLAKHICYARSNAACTGKLCHGLPSDWATPWLGYTQSGLSQCHLITAYAMFACVCVCHCTATGSDSISFHHTAV